MAENDPEPFGKPWPSVRRRSSDTVARLRRWDPGRQTAWHPGCRRSRPPIRTRMPTAIAENAVKPHRAPADLLLPSWLIRKPALPCSAAQMQSQADWEHVRIRGTQRAITLPPEPEPATPTGAAGRPA